MRHDPGRAALPIVAIGFLLATRSVAPLLLSTITGRIHVTSRALAAMRGILIVLASAVVMAVLTLGFLYIPDLLRLNDWPQWAVGIALFSIGGSVAGDIWWREFQALRASRRNQSQKRSTLGLLWHSQGSSTAAKGGSGHEFEILTVYTERRWGRLSIPNGWCLRVDDQVAHVDRSFHECKRVAKHIEEESTKAPFRPLRDEKIRKHAKRGGSFGSRPCGVRPSTLRSSS